MADPLSIIGSVIAILTAAEATYKGIKDIKRLPQAFQKLDTWLPLVRETLKEAEEHCHPADARGLEIEALKEAVETCKQQAEMLQDILKKLEPEDPASVRDKYWKILAAVGKKARVEELMRGILESVHAIACHRMMKAATTAHVGRLEAAIEELKSMQPSDDEVHDAKVVQSINNGQIDKAYNTLTWGNDNKTHTGSGHIFGTVTTLTLNSSSPKSDDIEKDKQRILRKLNSSSYREHKDRNPEAIQGTCVWLLEHESFQSWLENKSQSTTLWVSADPGCGKSVIARYLVDKILPKEERSSKIIYFFFKDDSDEQKTSSSALRSLLYQLLNNSSELFSEDVLKSLKKLGKKQFNSFIELWDVLVSIADHNKTGEIICVLDALDECEGLGRTQMINALLNLEKVRGIKFLFTSRPYYPIEKLFRSSETNIRIKGEDCTQTDKIETDIDQVANATVDGISREKELDEAETDLIRNKLTTTPNRTYLWVHLVCEMIRGMPGISHSNLVEFFKTLPNTVEKAYEKILSKSTDPEKAKILLHIVVAAARPLSLKEMDMAFATYTLRQDLSRHAKPGREASVQEMIRNVCGLFVTILDSKVYLIHQTAKEFLVSNHERPLRPSDEHSWQWNSSLNSGRSNHILMEICVAYLLIAGKTMEPSLEQELNNQESLKRYADEHELFDYSANYWASHARDSLSDNSKEMTNHLLDICNVNRPGCLLWFHYYWLTKTNRFFHIPNFTSLMIASYFGVDEVVRLLLQKEHSPNVNAVDKNSNSALWWAASNGNKAVVKELLKKKEGWFQGFNLPFSPRIDVNQEGLREETPLLVAARNGHKEVVELLVHEGDADANLADHISRTPLSYAAENGHDLVVSFLKTTARADPNKESKSGKTAYMYAAERVQTKVCKLLHQSHKEWERKKEHEEEHEEEQRRKQDEQRRHDEKRKQEELKQESERNHLPMLSRQVSQGERFFQSSTGIRRP